MPAEGLRGGGGFLPGQAGAARQAADMGQHRVDRLARAGDGAVDPLRRQQQRAGHAPATAELRQRRLQPGGIVEAGELVERGEDEHAARLAQQPEQAKPQPAGGVDQRAGVGYIADRPAEQQRDHAPGQGAEAANVP